MPYQLLLFEPSEEGSKDIGENVFLDSLSYDYKVYLFYYPGALPNVDLEEKLRYFGNITGNNLFINIGLLNDPKYYKIQNIFQIKDLPVIVLTASNGLASLESNNCHFTAYVKIDNKNLLKSVDSTIECIEGLFNLFIAGKISGAINQAKHENSEMIIFSIQTYVKNALKVLGKFLSDRDITVSLFEGKLELKKAV